MESVSKIAIVGSGMVGATFAYALIMKGLVRDLALIDLDRARAEGEVMDLNHSLSLLGPMNIQAGGYELCRDAQVVVITAGAAQKPGETRLDLAVKNARITQDVVRNILEHNPNPIILVTTNPVDILTYVALKVSGLPPSRVIGSGTVLDSSRFRFLLSRNCALDPRSIHAYIIGEHGDSEVALWSHVNVAGVPLDDYCPLCPHHCPSGVKEGIVEQVVKSAYQIIERKGATYYAIGVSLVRIVEAILKDQHSVLTVSTFIEDYYDQDDVCFSLPCIVGAQSRGVEQVIRPKLGPDEARLLRRSGEVLKAGLKDLGW